MSIFGPKGLIFSELLAANIHVPIIFMTGYATFDVRQR
jgi:hypothetical protein